MTVPRGENLLSKRTSHHCILWSCISLEERCEGVICWTMDRTGGSESDKQTVHVSPQVVKQGFKYIYMAEKKGRVLFGKREGTSTRGWGIIQEKWGLIQQKCLMRLN